jgi:transmembrane sensor
VNSPATALRASVASLEQAAQWYATLRDDRVTESDQRAWRAWLAQSPDHETAWAHIDAVSRKFDPLRGFGTPGTAAAMVGLDTARAKARGRRRALNALGAGAGLGLAAWLGWRYTPLPGLAMALRSDLHTGVGERRELALADGSRVWLNTRTALQVHWGPQERRLVLLAGEILVRTAPDAPQRPFCVDTGHGSLQALGTRFTVHGSGRSTRLDVFEGLVDIRTRGGQALRVPAGQAVEFDAQAISALRAAERMREAWSRGSLLADNLPLGQLLDEVGRYRHGHISVAPEVAGLQVMGVFPASDPEQALAMLEQALPIRVRRSLPWWTTVEAR